MYVTQVIKLFFAELGCLSLVTCIILIMLSHVSRWPMIVNTRVISWGHMC